MEHSTISKTKKATELGTFEIVTGLLRISDPCYDKDTWCAGTIENALPGIWKAKVITKLETYQYLNAEDWAKGKTFTDRRNVLYAVHESFDRTKPFEKKKMKISGGMDAGMAGIFDDKFYQVDYSEDYIKFGEQEYHDAQDEYRRNRDKELYEELCKRAPDLFASTQADKDRISLQVLKMEIARLPSSIKDNEGRKGFEEFAIRDAKRLKEMKERLARYEADPRSENLVERTRDWYEVCCDKSLSNIGAGVIRNGVVSSSGYGDGGFTTYAVYVDGKVVGVKLVF